MLAIKIGRPLVPLNFAQQRFEADFRFSLVRLRENAKALLSTVARRWNWVFFKSVFEVYSRTFGRS